MFKKRSLSEEAYEPFIFHLNVNGAVEEHISMKILMFFFFPVQLYVLRAAGTGGFVWLQESAAVQRDGWVAPATLVSSDCNTSGHVCPLTGIFCSLESLLAVLSSCQPISSEFPAQSFHRCDTSVASCRIYSAVSGFY